LMRPILGGARLCQAIAPTNGLKKNGIRLYGSSRSRHGQLVRALIQASDTPSKIASTVEPALIKSVLTNAFGMMRSVKRARKLSSPQVASKPPASSTWKLLMISVNNGSNPAPATITLTIRVATDSWVTRLRQRLESGASVTTVDIV